MLREIALGSTGGSRNMALHLKAFFAHDEVGQASTCEDYLQVRQGGCPLGSRNLRHYPPPAILDSLFQVTVPTVNERLKGIVAEGR